MDQKNDTLCKTLRIWFKMVIVELFTKEKSTEKIHQKTEMQFSS